MTVAPLCVELRPKSMLAPEREQQLSLEHRRLARHLADTDVTPYQVSKYVNFHRRRALDPSQRVRCPVTACRKHWGAGPLVGRGLQWNIVPSMRPACEAHASDPRVHCTQHQ
jgi:hypothetical protein